MSRELTLRASDADREGVVAALRDHCSAGRLTVAELEERTAAAYVARTLDELGALTCDLPQPQSAPGAVPKGDHTRHITATLTTTEQAGAWRVPERLVARARLGECRIDLRGAELPDELHIDARVVLGEIHIYVPVGCRVEMSGRAFMATKCVRGAREQPQSGPRIFVDVRAVLGEVTVDTTTTGEKWLRAARSVGALGRGHGPE